MSTGIVSPFQIPRKHLEDLANNNAFTAVREHLRRQELGMDAPSFCSHHRDSCSHQDQESFRLHRDIIHTLLVPLFLLHTQASRIATSVLPSSRATEPERAFKGEARSAYAWLHCILSEEHDWYLTERCPACIVLHVMHSEPTIRFIAVACLLSGHLQGHDVPVGKRRLPSFDFWLETLETAVREDTFWGDDFWPEIEYRACSLTDGVKQLAMQCLELQSTAEQREFEQSQTQVHTVKQTNCAWKQVPVAAEDQKRLKMNNCFMQSRRHQRFHVRSVDSRRINMT